MKAGRMAPGDATTLQDTATIYRGILAQQDESTTALTPKQDTKTIHQKERNEMYTPEVKLKEQWRLGNQSILEQMMNTTGENKRNRKDKCVTDSEKPKSRKS